MPSAEQSILSLQGYMGAMINNGFLLEDSPRPSQLPGPSAPRQGTPRDSGAATVPLLCVNPIQGQIITGRSCGGSLIPPLIGGCRWQGAIIAVLPAQANAGGGGGR